MLTKVFNSTPYGSEKDPTYINLHHTGLEDLLGNETVTYIVRGTVFSVQTNTELDFRKDFEEIIDAEKYFDDMKKEHPISEIIMQKEVLRDIKLYI